ncbi:MAG: hypothetical protein ACR2RE_04725 [Geminicoccaceae bacterium]
MGKKVFKGISKAIIAPVEFAAKHTADLGEAVVDPFAKAIGKVTGSALGGLTGGAPAVEVPPAVVADTPAEDDDIEQQAAQTVRRRTRQRPRSRTLLDTGLGGGQATVGRPTLLGGG